MKSGVPSVIGRRLRPFFRVPPGARIRLGYASARQTCYRLTASKRALPAFLIIGAQKSGTTSLYEYLIDHAQVLPSVRKEVHYFDLNYRKGLNWYKSHFPRTSKLASLDAITGEASPYYMVHPQALQRITADLPDVKLIALLRNPVDRIISHYFHEKRYRTEARALLHAVQADAALSDEEWVEQDQSRSTRQKKYRRHEYLHRSMYIEQIRPILPLVSEQKLLLLRAEDLFSQPHATMARTCDYLGIRPPSEAAQYHVANKGNGDRVASSDRAALADMLAPSLEELKRKTGISWDLES